MTEPSACWQFFIPVWSKRDMQLDGRIQTNVQWNGLRVDDAYRKGDNQDE